MLRGVRLEREDHLWGVANTDGSKWVLITSQEMLLISLELFFLLTCRPPSCFIHDSFVQSRQISDHSFLWNYQLILWGNMSSERSSGTQRPVIARLFYLRGYCGAQRWSASAVQSSQREEDACFVSVCHAFAELKTLRRSSFTWSDRYSLTSDSEYVQWRCGETGRDISLNGALPIWIFYLAPHSSRLDVTHLGQILPDTWGGQCRLTKGQVWSCCGIGPAYWPGADCNVNLYTGGMQMVRGATG